MARRPYTGTALPRFKEQLSEWQEKGAGRIAGSTAWTSPAKVPYAANTAYAVYSIPTSGISAPGPSVPGGERWQLRAASWSLAVVGGGEFPGHGSNYYDATMATWKLLIGYAGEVEQGISLLSFDQSALTITGTDRVLVEDYPTAAAASYQLVAGKPMGLTVTYQWTQPLVLNSGESLTALWTPNVTQDSARRLSLSTILRVTRQRQTDPYDTNRTT